MVMCLVQLIDLHPFTGGLENPLVLWFQSSKYITYCKIKKFMQTLYGDRYASGKTDSSGEEPEVESTFQLKETWTRIQRKKQAI